MYSICQNENDGICQRRPYNRSGAYMKISIPAWLFDLIGVILGWGLSFLTGQFFGNADSDIGVVFQSFLFSFGILSSFVFQIVLLGRCMKALFHRHGKKSLAASSYTKLPVGIVILFGTIVVVLSLFDAVGGSNDFAAGLSLLSLFLWYFAVQIIVVVLAVRGVEALVRRAQGKHSKPPVSTYRSVDSGVMVDGLKNGYGTNGEVYIYNRDEAFRMNPDAAMLSWRLICLLLFLVPPFGAFLLVAKTREERENGNRNGAVLQVYGILIALLSSAFILLIAVTGADSIQAFLAVIALPGVTTALGSAVAIYGKWLKCRAQKEDLYRKLITVNRITDLDALAGQTGSDYAHVSTIVDRLINTGLLGNAYISHYDREVIVPGISQKIARRCSSCGGTTVLRINDSLICDYCGGNL